MIAQIFIEVKIMDSFREFVLDRKGVPQIYSIHGSVLEEVCTHTEALSEALNAARATGHAQILIHISERRSAKENTARYIDQELDRVAQALVFSDKERFSFNTKQAQLADQTVCVLVTHIEYKKKE